MSPPPNERLFPSDASIVLIGCRGAGKSTLGFFCSIHLRWRLVTEEYYFQITTGLTRADYLAKHGKESFSRQNANVFRRMLDANRTNCVIECSMTSLGPEAQAALAQYSRTNPVIYVHRETEQVMPFLDEEDADQILLADQTHRTCSNLEYYNLFDPSNNEPSPPSSVPPLDSRAFSPAKLSSLKLDFTRWLDQVLGRERGKTWLQSPFSVSAVPPEYRQNSYALRLRLSYLISMDLEWEDFEARGDCVELVVDHWPNDMMNVIARQVSLIRRKLNVPVIFHVEEDPRGERRRPAEEKDRVDLELLELGLRLGVEYLSLDLERNQTILTHVLVRRGRTKIIGNFWNAGLHAIPWEDSVHLQNFSMGQSLGCDVIRMARFCMGDSAAERLDEFRQRLDEAIPDAKPPLVAYDYSVLGIRTPPQSHILSPVKHPDMESGRDHLATVTTAFHGLQLQFRQFLLDPLQYYALGADVSHSIAQAMHQAAYEFCGMPHTFEARQCSTLGELDQICRSPSFGGACLSAPFKLAIVPHLKHKSHHAEAIGAANVLLPLRGKTSLILDHANTRNKAGTAAEFYGDNDDWKAIESCLRRANSPRNYVQPSRTTALVVGSGGMARAAVYALVQMRCRNIFIYNRTVRNAEDVARHFNEWAVRQGLFPDPAEGVGPRRICRVLTSTSQPWPAGFQQPTLVVSCVPAVSVDGGKAVGFEMPLQWLESPTGGVVLELAYEPLIAPLVSQMRAYRDKLSAPWVVVDGLENVSEMSIESFELMTGRPAPRRLMKDVCRKAWEQNREQSSSVSG